MDLPEDLCVRVAEIRVGSAPILECTPQAAGHLGNIRLTSFDSGGHQTLVFSIQIATNEASNAFPGFSHMRGLCLLFAQDRTACPRPLRASCLRSRRSPFKCHSRLIASRRFACSS